MIYDEILTPFINEDEDGEEEVEEGNDNVEEIGEDEKEGVEGDE